MTFIEWSFIARTMNSNFEYCLIYLHLDWCQWNQPEFRARLWEDSMSHIALEIPFEILSSCSFHWKNLPFGVAPVSVSNRLILFWNQTSSISRMIYHPIICQHMHFSWPCFESKCQLFVFVIFSQLKFVGNQFAS